jgi:hypothetical protein
MGVPTAAHFIYIPFVLLVGIVIGWILGGRAQREAAALEEARKREREERRAARRAKSESPPPGE